MQWKIDFTEKAVEGIKRLDKPVRERIRKFIDRLEKMSDPRMTGEPLTGNLSDFWKYRTGDYRIICRIHDKELIVLVVKVGHRREVYKR